MEASPAWSRAGGGVGVEDDFVGVVDPIGFVLGLLDGVDSEPGNADQDHQHQEKEADDPFFNIFFHYPDMVSLKINLDAGGGGAGHRVRAGRLGLHHGGQDGADAVGIGKLGGGGPVLAERG